MRDQEMVELFWRRSEQALDEVESAYGFQLRRLAGNLLGNPQDVEECLNDAYLALWDAIPPARPQPLLPYALRVVRNLCLKRRRYNTAQRRFSPFDAAFGELEHMLADESAGPEHRQDAAELTAALEGFLRGLPRRDRQLFLGRYWYGASHRDLGLRLGMSENNAAVRLSRLRDKLRRYLQEKEVL